MSLIKLYSSHFPIGKHSSKFYSKFTASIYRAFLRYLYDFQSIKATLLPTYFKVRLISANHVFFTLFAPISFNFFTVKLLDSCQSGSIVDEFDLVSLKISNGGFYLNNNRMNPLNSSIKINCS